MYITVLKMFTVAKKTFNPGIYRLGYRKLKKKLGL